MSVYFWQQHEWQALAQAYRQQRLAHALLLSAGAGMGLLEFAYKLANAVLCTGDELASCGSCKACKLFAAGTHPDFHLLELEVNARDGKLARDIKVDQIRSATAALQLHAKQDGYKVLIINPAERMNKNAANSLLKTLEEPSANTLIILLSEARGQLLPTITSRCQQYHFAKPDNDKVIEWLQGQLENPNDAAKLLALGNGAPLAALAAREFLELREALYQGLLDAQNAPNVAAALNKNIASPADLERVCHWLQIWLGDILKLQNNCAEIVNIDYRHKLQALSAKLASAKLFDFYNKVLRQTALCYHPLNQQQVLEGLFLGWAAVSAP